MSTRNSSSSESYGRYGQVLCRHKQPAILQTTWKDPKNYGKRFYTCTRWMVATEHCQFFRWYDDEEYGPRAIEVMTLLRTQIEDLKQLNGSRVNQTNASASPSSFSSKLIKCEEEKKVVELQVNQLRVKKNAYKSEVLALKGELDRMKCTHVSKSEIEMQQANLMGLIQTFMGTSYSGINSLEARVSGLEKALDGISHNLGIQGGRNPNESTGNSCCIIRGAEFLSPNFWRKNENGRFAASKTCCSGGMHSVPYKDNNVSIREMEVISQSDSTRESGRNSEANSSSRTMIKNTIAQRRSCSSGSLDGASPRTCITPMAQRT